MNSVCIPGAVRWADVEQKRPSRKGMKPNARLNPIESSTPASYIVSGLQVRSDVDMLPNIVRQNTENWHA